jgi:hypothetical protein
MCFKVDDNDLMSEKISLFVSKGGTNYLLLTLGISEEEEEDDGDDDTDSELSNEIDSPLDDEDGDAEDDLP